MPNGRCRMYGGASTGPRIAEGLARPRRAHWKHGLYSAEAMALALAPACRIGYVIDEERPHEAIRLRLRDLGGT
jgi:hypothetical protein